MSSALSSIREGYDRWASVYDHDANPLQALEESYVRRAIENLAQRPGTSRLKPIKDALPESVGYPEIRLVVAALRLAGAAASATSPEREPIDGP